MRDRLNLYGEVERMISEGKSANTIRRRVLTFASQRDVRQWAEEWVDDVIRRATRSATWEAEQQSARSARQREADELAERDQQAERAWRQRPWADPKYDPQSVADYTAGLRRSRLPPEEQERLLDRYRRKEEQRAARWAEWWASLTPDERRHREKIRDGDVWTWQNKRAMEHDAMHAWLAERNLRESERNLRASIQLELTRELLSAKIALGDGVVVTWGEATPAQLRQRAAFLMAMARGDIRTAARLNAAADMIEAATATCLDDLALGRLPC